MMVAQRPVVSPGATAVDASQSLPMPPMGAYGEPAPAKQEVQQFPSPLPMDDANSLGLSFLLLAVGTVAGIKYIGGAYGGAAGAIYGGAAGNLLRAARMVTYGTSSSDHEAMISATYGILGTGFASYILWKVKQPKRSAA